MVERSFNDILNVSVDSNETKVFNSTTAGILKAISPDGEVVIDSNEVVIPGLIADTASFALTASYTISASYASQAGNSSTIDINVFAAPVDSYLLMSNVAGTTGVAIGGDADLRYNTSTNVLTAPNVSATTLTGSLLGTASYAMSALSASYFGGSVISASYALTASYLQSTASNAISASTALTASKIFVTNLALDAGTYYPMFANTTFGAANLFADALTYTYQPSTNILTVTASSAFTASYVEPYETAWTSYTPTWTTPGTQPVLGDGTLTGAYKQIGKTVFVRVRLVFGTTTTGGTGDWQFGLPVSASDAAGIQFPCSILDAGNAWYQATVNGQYSGLTHRSSIIGQSVGANSSQGITSTFPITWGNSDSLQFNGSYEAA